MSELNWDVTIRKAGNGIMVSIGCKTLVFKTTDLPEFLADLSGYINDDVNVGKKYFPEQFKSSSKGYPEVPPPYYGEEVCAAQTAGSGRLL